MLSYCKLFLIYSILYFENYSLCCRSAKIIIFNSKTLWLIHVDIGGHPPIPTSSSCPFFVQHVLLYLFVIMGSTLLGISESLHILQVDTGGLFPNPTGLFCMFSCQHIVLYFQGLFGALNIVLLSST